MIMLPVLLSQSFSACWYAEVACCCRVLLLYMLLVTAPTGEAHFRALLLFFYGQTQHVIGHVWFHCLECAGACCFSARSFREAHTYFHYHAACFQEPRDAAFSFLYQ